MSGESRHPNGHTPHGRQPGHIARFGPTAWPRRLGHADRRRVRDGHVFRRFQLRHEDAGFRGTDGHPDAGDPGRARRPARKRRHGFRLPVLHRLARARGQRAAARLVPAGGGDPVRDRLPDDPRPPAARRGTSTRPAPPRCRCGAACTTPAARDGVVADAVISRLSGLPGQAAAKLCRKSRKKLLASGMPRLIHTGNGRELAGQGSDGRGGIGRSGHDAALTGRGTAGTGLPRQWQPGVLSGAASKGLDRRDAPGRTRSRGARSPEPRCQALRSSRARLRHKRYARLFNLAIRMDKMPTK